MSTFLASNFIINLSFNLQPRLLHLSLPRLKRSVVRCLCHKSDGSESPVRYIPKKFRDVNQAQSSSSGGKTPKNANGARSSSSNGILGHKTLDTMERPRRSKIDHEQSNVASDDAHVHVVSRANDDRKHGKRDVETKSRKVHQEAVEYMNVPQEVVGELQNIKRDVQGQGCKFNQENSYDYDDVLGDSEYMEPLEEDLEEKKFINGVGDGKEKRSGASRIKQGAEKLAIELLAKRAFTGVELRKKLTANKYPVNVVDTVLNDFQNRGLINDSLYAEMFSHSRWRSSSWGPRRIKQALVKKGVSESDVEKAIKVVFEDGEDTEDNDRGSSMKLSESSLQNLYVQASKHWQRSHNVPHETRKARLIRWLQYRGFDWGVVSNMLKKLESNHPP